MLDNDDDEEDHTNNRLEEDDTYTLDTFITSVEQMPTATTKQLVSSLNDKAFMHLISPTDNAPVNTPVNTNTKVLTSSTSKRYDSDRFYGVMIDTGASMKSTVGYD